MGRKNNEIYKSEEFYNLREVIQNSARKYHDNVAFIIKKKPGEYEKITYAQFQDDINALRNVLL